MPALRLLLDEGVPILLAATLRARGYDAVHATEVGLGQREDDEVFAAAITEERAVLTHNIGDFVSITRELGGKVPWVPPCGTQENVLGSPYGSHERPPSRLTGVLTSTVCS